jgi:hypothetical protein
MDALQYLLVLHMVACRLLPANAPTPSHAMSQEPTHQCDGVHNERFFDGPVQG